MLSKFQNEKEEKYDIVEEIKSKEKDESDKLSENIIQSGEFSYGDQSIDRWENVDGKLLPVYYDPCHDPCYDNIMHELSVD